MTGGRTRPSIAAAAIAAAALVSGCSGTASDAPAPEWAVSAVPTVSVGMVEGDSVFLFQYITDVALGPAGELVVADAGLGVVRIFGPDGDFVAQAGRLGDGPGEFQGLRSLAVVGDEFAAWDSEAARITWFDLAGGERRTVSLERSAAANGFGTLDPLVGVLPDSSILVATVGLGSRDRMGADLVSVERFSADGAHLGRLLETTGFERAQLAARRAGPMAFSPRPMFAMDGPAFLHTTGLHPVIVRVATGGSDSIAVDVPRAPLGGAWDVLRERLSETGNRFYEDAIDESPRPDSLPALGGLVAAGSGTIWVKRFDPGTDALWLAASNGAGGVWIVVAADGGTVARVSLPDGFVPHAVTDSTVVGVHTDALGIQRVQVYGVTRPPR